MDESGGLLDVDLPLVFGRRYDIAVVFADQMAIEDGVDIVRNLVVQRFETHDALFGVVLVFFFDQLFLRHTVLVFAAPSLFRLGIRCVLRCCSLLFRGACALLFQCLQLALQVEVAFIERVVRVVVVLRLLALGRCRGWSRFFFCWGRSWLGGSGLLFAGTGVVLIGHLCDHAFVFVELGVVDVDVFEVVHKNYDY